MDCSPPGSSVHGILQARILEWVAMPFSRGPSWPRDWTWVSSIAGRFFTNWTTKDVFVILIAISYYIVKAGCSWKWTTVTFLSSIRLGQSFSFPQGNVAMWGRAAESAWHPPGAPQWLARVQGKMFFNLSWLSESPEEFMNIYIDSLGDTSF